MTPTRKGDPKEPSSDTLPLDKQYDVPTALPQDVQGKTDRLYDLCAELPDWCDHA